MKSDCKDGGSSLDGRLYDEFRLSELGHLVHEIEWAQDAHWIIAANDIDFRWIPIKQITANNPHSLLLTRHWSFTAASARPLPASAPLQAPRCCRRRTRAGSGCG